MNLTILDDIPLDQKSSVTLKPSQLDTVISPLLIPGHITLLHGLHRAPMTVLLHEFAVGAIRVGGKSLFVDSGNNFKPQLARKMFGRNYQESMKDLIVAKVLGLDDMDEMIESVVPHFSMVVVDSLTGVLNLHGPPGTKKRQRRLFTSLERLRESLLDTNVHLILSDHSSRDPITGSSRPIGGNIIQHSTDTMIRVDFLNSKTRTFRLKIERSPFITSPDGLLVRIGEFGIRPIRSE